MTLTLKLNGRTVRGRCWKDLSISGKPINQGAILSGKICSNCNQAPDFDKEVIKCMKCDHSFHVKCLLLPISEDDVKNISENPSMWWFCLSCTSVKSTDSTYSSTSENITVPSDVLLQKELTTFKKDMLNLIGETIDRKFKDQRATHTNLAVNSSAKEKSEIARKNNAWSNSPITHDSEYPALSNNMTENHQLINKGVAKKHVLLLDPADPEMVKSDNFKKRTVQNVNKAIHGINVNFCNVKKSGVVAIGFDDIKSKQCAEEKIKENVEISEIFSTRSPKQLLPKVTLQGINEVVFDDCTDKSEMKTALLKDILFRNNDIKQVVDSSPDELIEVLMIQKYMPSEHTVSYSAVLKLSSNVRKVIHKNANKIYVSLSRCRVIDKYQILQCYHCQKPGHHSNNCTKKNEDPTCLYCGGKHTSRLCTDKNNTCCTNCFHSNNDLYQSNAQSHNAASIHCPILRPFRDDIKQKTENWSGKK